MTQVTKTVDKTLVQGDEIFIYTVDVSYGGLTQPSQDGYLIDFFPSKIKYILPPIGGQIQSIIETPVAGGTEIRFNFGLVTSGTSLSFTVACSFGPGRVQGDTFMNEAMLFADQTLVATGVALTVTLVLIEQFSLSKNIDDGVVSTMLPTEPNKVGVSIFPDLLSSIGQLVWLDTNGDGIYQPTETGVNGVNVILYNALFHQIASTVTSNNAAGEPGYYKFSGLLPGIYYVKFEPQLPYELTVQQENVPNGSKPNPLTGFTGLILLGINKHRTDINAGVLVPCAPPVIYAHDRCVRVGATFYPMKGVRAKDCHGNDITDDVIIKENTVNTEVEGIYRVVYRVTDEYWQATEKTIKVVVCKVNARQQAITDLLESVALQEAAVAHILNAEGEKLQKCTGSSAHATHEQLIAVNRSVKEMIKSLTKFEIILGGKVDLFKCDLCSDGCCDRRD